MTKTAKVIIFSIIILLISFFSTPFLGVVKSEEKDDEKKDFCLFCDVPDEEEKKEKQFAKKIEIIKDIFGNKINSAVLAATVLYTNYEKGVNKYYEDDFSASDFKSEWNDIKDSLSSGNADDFSSNEDIDNEQIDLLTSATIVMLLSNNFGSYNEEAYKNALMVDKGYVPDDIKLGPIEANLLLCSPPSQVLGSAFTTVIGGIRTLNPFDDYTIVDSIRYVLDLKSICDHGFLETAYKTVSEIEDSKQRKVAKQKVAESIIELAKTYKPWFGIDDCDYDNDPTDDDSINWRQANPAQSWSSLPVGGGGTVAEIGCTSVSMAYIINKSGTKLSKPNFDPGVLVKNVSYTSGGAFMWGTEDSVAPYWKDDGKTGGSLTGSASEKAKKIADILNTPAEGKYQQFVVLYRSDPQHWVAVDHVENDEIYILDPAYSGEGLTTETNIYNAPPTTDGYRVFYATDVEFWGENNNGVRPSSSSSKNKSSSSGSMNYSSDNYKNRLNNLNKYKQCSESIGKIKLKNTNICNAGDMIASIAAINYMFTGKETDVEKLAKDLIDMGAWTTSGGSATPYFDSPDSNKGRKIRDNWGLAGTNIKSGDIKENIIKELKDGKKILVYLQGANAKYSTKDGHYIILDHYDEDSKKIYLFDPKDPNVSPNGEYITEESLSNDVVKYNKNGPWAFSGDANNDKDICNKSDDEILEGFVRFIGCLEGRGTCNYQGRGEGTGYSVTVLADGAGPTTAYGLTQWVEKYATESGYTNFKTDLYSGCTEKESIEKLIRYYLKTGMEEIKEENSDMNLSTMELVLLTSVRHGGSPGYKKVRDTIKEHGSDSFELYRCMVTIGCSFTNGTYAEGLINRRVAEYEMFTTEDFGACNAGKWATAQSITTESQLEKFKKENWPSSETKCACEVD